MAPQPRTRHHAFASCQRWPGTLDGLLSADEQRALSDAVLERPTKAIRLRPDAAFGTASSVPVPFPTEPVPWYSAGLFCPGTHQPGRFLSHAAGSYFVQDAGSMLALAAVDPQPAEWIADVCAAPGAKASALLEVVGPGGGFLLANEPIRGRLPALAYNLSRVGFPRWLMTAADPERLEACWRERFDAVLVDAPCTGQALVGRGRQSASAFSQAQIDHSAARQQRILTAASRLVRPGGRLVYSTCTFTTEENERVIAGFLGRNGSWQVEPVAELAAWASPLEPGGYRLYPHRDRCGGSYAIRLRRVDGHAIEQASAEGFGRRGLPEGSTRGFEPVVIGGDQVGRIRGSTRRIGDSREEDWPSDLMPSLESCRGRGSERAYRPNRHWMPAHDLALRRDPDWQPLATLELDDSQAQAFLQGSPLAAGPLGWCVATWRGHPLGWLRGSRDRCNNGLPAAARLSVPPVIG
jgi:16S rRNA C967 or C1407 C5-methylase (RsmB/RsmF family)